MQHGYLVLSECMVLAVKYYSQFSRNVEERLLQLQHHMAVAYVLCICGTAIVCSYGYLF